MFVNCQSIVYMSFWNLVSMESSEGRFLTPCMEVVMNIHRFINSALPLPSGKGRKKIFISCNTQTLMCCWLAAVFQAPSVRVKRQEGSQINLLL